MPTFDELENSNYDGQPVALYLFRIGDVYWYYTSADQEITWPSPLGGNVQWLPIAISDNGTRRGNVDSEDFTVTVPSDLDIVDLFRATAPSETIWLTAMRLHWPDPASAPVYWKGTIVAVRRPKETAQARLIGRPIGASFERGGLRLSYQRNCPHVLYDHGCKADKELHKAEVTVGSLTGNTFDVVGFAGDPALFKGGFCRWERMAGLTERRGIIQMTGTTVEVIGTTDGMEVGMAITLFEGCAHTPEACQNQFNNMDNYGGFPHLPAKSPFDGDPVF